MPSVRFIIIFYNVALSTEHQTGVWLNPIGRISVMIEAFSNTVLLYIVVILKVYKTTKENVIK